MKPFFSDAPGFKSSKIKFFSYDKLTNSVWTGPYCLSLEELKRLVKWLSVAILKIEKNN